jgi:hypothetical protein
LTPSEVAVSTFVDQRYYSNQFGRFMTLDPGPAVQHPSFTPGAAGIQFNEMYSYTQAGQPNKKRLQVNETPPYPYATQTRNLDAVYTYDSEGKMTSVNYPTTYGFVYPNLVPTAGPTYTCSLDSMSRPMGLTDQNNYAAVSNVQYGGACAPANQLSVVRRKPVIHAAAQYTGNTIYYSALYFSQIGSGTAMYTMFHEALHLMGFDDNQLKGLFGITDGEWRAFGTDAITHKLEEKCGH